MFDYLMESGEETHRLDLKTDELQVERHAIWAGLQPNMSVIDVCCGSGKTTSVLHRLAKPNCNTVGIDASAERIAFASDHYEIDGLRFIQRNVLQPLDDLGTYDFVWLRFVLEFFKDNSFDVIKNIHNLVKPGGILCLIDLDNNSLFHYPIEPQLQRTLYDIVRVGSEKANFDPYAGSKLISHLYNLGYGGLRADVSGHNIITGDLKDRDAYNWLQKMEIVRTKLGYNFPEYPGGFNEFRESFMTFFKDPMRFSYTPIIVACGIRPLENAATQN